jgi:ribosomal protein L3 glutamine methyltransferase
MHSVNAKTVLEAIHQVEQIFIKSDIYCGHGTDNTWDEAVFLVLGACNYPLISGGEVAEIEIDLLQRERIEAWVKRRTVDREPLPYISGKAWFGGLEFLCDRRALVPRSPLAEIIQQRFEPWHTGPVESVLDLCCGGGSLGLLTAIGIEEAHVALADIDGDALALAYENALLLGLSERVELIKSDVLTGVPQKRFDVVLCNPPYVDGEDMSVLPPEYRHEPGIALASGADGLDFTRALLVQLPAFLHDHATVFLELGNSWAHFDALFQDYPLTWLEFAQGGWGVCALSKHDIEELARIAAQRGIISAHE